MSSGNLILGAGVTGLAAGIASGAPVYEAADAPGGICRSYKKEEYRFEIAGGHWIFGGDSAVLYFINQLAVTKQYARVASIYFSKTDRTAPYPLQNHLEFLDRKIARKAAEEIAHPNSLAYYTMKGWLLHSFGPTLCELFFFPFNKRYTAELYSQIAPQDTYKNPTNATGYNPTFLYPTAGLDVLADRMATRCLVNCGHSASRIDVTEKAVFFEHKVQTYDHLISTLPLNKILQLAGLTVEARADPMTSVLVLNIGAKRGKRCPISHWVYIPDSTSGFHRIGFYSNVNSSFLPINSQDRVSLYVERSFAEDTILADEFLMDYVKQVVSELRDWQFIESVDVVDSTYIKAAYTWSWPKSTWKLLALKKLEANGIYSVGRYGRWIFQGIADSIRDGFIVGSCFRT
jgi:protoporphyrinogen oxidase